MIYDDACRGEFDEEAQSHLDLLKERFGTVEILRPKEALDPTAWFVQIRLKKYPYPMGAFGKTPSVAAERLLLMSRTWKQN